MKFYNELLYYTEIDFYMTGIGAKFRYNISNPIRLEGAFTYFFPKEDESFYFYSPKIHLWDLSVNGHYLFPVSNKFVIYPLVGMSVLKSTATASVLGVSASVSESRVGFNFGGGLDFKVSDNIGINVEPKLVIGGGETPSGIQIQIIISAGAVYNF